MRKERKRRKRIRRSDEIKKKRANQVIAEGQALVDAKLKELEVARRKHEYLARRYYGRWRALVNQKQIVKCAAVKTVGFTRFNI